MLKRNYKGRCVKRSIPKCREVCRTYSDIQYKYADMLQADSSIAEFQCNVLLDSGEYTTDFVCVKSDNHFMVRECVNRKLLTKPMTVKLLDISRTYWLKHGVADWGIVINED